MKWLRKKHLMVDIETADTLPSAAIMSIGACIFHLDGLGVQEKFYVNVDAADGKRLGCTVGKDTMKFWSEQSKEVIRSLHVPSPVPVKDALEQFFQFYKDTGAEMIWAHGAAFDLPIIDFSANKVGLKPPYAYRHVMCNRTVMSMLDSAVPKGNDAHNALADAVYQAQHLISLFEKPPF